MNIQNKITDSTLRKIVILITLFCLSASVLALVKNMFTERAKNLGFHLNSEKDGEKIEKGFLVDSVVTGSSSDISGIKKGDILLMIGNKEFKNMNELYEILSQYENNEMMEFTLLRDDEIIKTFPLAISMKLDFKVDSETIINWIFGFGFLVIGFLVGYSKPKEFTSILFFFLGCTASIQSAISKNVIYDDFIKLCFAIGIFFSPLFVHFSITYPIKVEFKYRKKFLVVCYVLTILTASGVFFFKAQIGFDYDYLTLILIILSGVIPNIFIITGFIFFLKSYKKKRNTSIGKPLKIVLYGLIIGLGSTYFLFLLFVFAPIQDSEQLLPLIIIVNSMSLAIPISFGISIFKYRILDTEFLVKKGIVFGITMSLLIGIYFAVVFLLTKLISSYLPENKDLITIATIILVTLSFDFIRKNVREFVDKQFYREKYNYRKSLLQISNELPYLNSIREILEKIANSIKDTMGAENMDVLFKDDEFKKILRDELGAKTERSKFGDYELNTSLVDENDSISLDDIFRLFHNNKNHKLLIDVYLQEFNISKQIKEIIKNEKWILAIPVFIKSNLIGVMVFGEKSSGKAYSEEDIDLLKSLASHASIAFENSRLQQAKISHQKTEEEIDIARSVQRGLLPRTISVIEGIEISGFYQPARTIGGDFYDIIKLGDNKILIVVADVSGKGIPAALIMSKILGMIQIYANLYHSPKRILSEVNKQIQGRISKKTFVTSVVALFDLENMTVKVCSAGHNPIIYSDNGELKFLEIKGMSLGLAGDKLFDANITEKEIYISRDNLFIFYSDGLTEAMNREKEEYGTDEVIRIIDINKNNSCSTIQDELVNSVAKFRDKAEQNDDITFVVTKIK